MPAKQDPLALLSTPGRPNPPPVHHSRTARLYGTGWHPSGVAHLVPLDGGGLRAGHAFGLRQSPSVVDSA